LSFQNPTGQTVTVNGDTSGLAPGQVLVGGDGHGFIGRIESISPQSGGAVVTYSPATIEDLFDYADVSLDRALSYDMLESFVPNVEGLTLEPATWTAGAAASSGKQSDATLAAFRVEFPEKEFIYGSQIQGALEFKLDAGLDFQVGEGWPFLSCSTLTSTPT
jgi:hypothetical protein